MTQFIQQSAKGQCNHFNIVCVYNPNIYSPHTSQSLILKRSVIKQSNYIPILACRHLQRPDVISYDHHTVSRKEQINNPF